MTLEFDFENVTITEFGVGRDDAEGKVFYLVAVDGDVQDALREMAASTWAEMQGLSEAPAQYEPSEKHAGLEHVYLPLANELATVMRQLHEAANLVMDTAALDDPVDIFCYFCRMTDGQARRLTGL